MSKKKHTSTDDAPSSGYSIIDRLNDIALKIYGAADRSDLDVAGEKRARQVQDYCREVEEHFVVEKDEHGNEYLYHKDDSAEGTATGSSPHN
jgi:hypothetical protein